MAKNHTKYKSTPFGKIPFEWNLKTDNEITNFHKQGYYTKETDNTDGKYYLLRGTDLQNQRIDYSTTPKIDASAKDYEQFKAEKGDFLIVRSGAIGRYGIFNSHPPSIFGSYLIKFRFNQEVLNEYFGMFYESNVCLNQLGKITQGSTNININAENIKALSIPLPTIKEQKRITEILGTWAEAIEILEQLIAKKERNKKALMQLLLTGKKRFKEFKGMKVQISLISDFCKTFSGGTPLRSKTEYYGGDIPWLKSGELNNENIFHTEERITEDALKNSSAKVAEKGTILLALYGATAGVVAQTHIKTAVNQAILALIPDKKVENKYLFYYLKMIMPFELNRLLQGGQPNLSADMVKNMEIRIPTIEEQRKIISLLISSDEEINGYKKHLIHCKKQKQGLMQLLLTGQKRVKV